MDCRTPGLLSMVLPKQEYWSGLPFSSAGDLPDPGTEPVSPALVGVFFTTEAPGKPLDERGTNYCDYIAGICSCELSDK